MISYTAQVIAGRRALCTENHSPYIQDPFAHLFVSDEIRQRCLDTDAPVHGVILRNRLYEDFVVKPPVDFEQMIILGSGFDAKFQKHASLRDKVYIEVDEPDTQNFKQKILEENGLPKPQMVAKRIESLDDFKDVLKMTNPNQRTLLMMEGFTMYQPQGFLFEMLQTCLAYYSLTPCLAFDAMQPQSTWAEDSKQTAKRIEKRGEHIIAFYRPEEIQDFFKSYPVNFEVWSKTKMYEHYVGQQADVNLGFSSFVCFAYDENFVWVP